MKNRRKTTIGTARRVIEGRSRENMVLIPPEMVLEPRFRKELMTVLSKLLQH